MIHQAFENRLNKINATLDRVAASQAETAKQQAETAEQFKAYQEAVAKQREEDAKEFKAYQEAVAKQREEDAKQFKAYQEAVAKQQAELKKEVQETTRVVREVSRRFGDAENNKGKVTELHFYRYFQKHPYLGEVRFDEVHHAFFYKEGQTNQEHDIVMLNSDKAATLSVKYKVTRFAVEYLITQELHSLRYYFLTRHDIQHIYLGVAGMMITPDALAYANEKGVFAWTQSGENTELLNPKGFTPTQW